MKTVFCRQELPTFCFIACLESFLAENGVFLTQTEIFNRCGSVVGQHPNDKGAFAPLPHHWRSIEGALGLASLQTPDANNIPKVSLPKESVFARIDWDYSGNNHWVRVLDTDSDYWYLMDPAYPFGHRKIEKTKICSWAKICFIVTKV